MRIKNNFPEFSDDWVFIPEKNTNIQNQVIFNCNDLSLLNVRKIFTNGVYWGIIYTVLTSEGIVMHHFRCKDRGFTEELVDDKESFISLFKQTTQSTKKSITRSKFKVVKANFLQEYEVAFLINDNGDYFATTANVNNSPTRGLYGSTNQEEYDERIKTFGFSILNRLPTEEEVKVHLIDKQINSLSANFITRVNTAYSNIKIYHKSEVNNGTQTTTKITS